MNMLVAADILGYTAAGIGTVMFLPQVITVWKTKQTKAISTMSFAMLATVSVLWTFYGIIKQAPPVILVNITLFVLSMIILFFKRRYG
jgi:MtN3 and saliva related transmembrane protein